MITITSCGINSAIVPLGQPATARRRQPLSALVEHSNSAILYVLGQLHAHASPRARRVLSHKSKLPHFAEMKIKTSPFACRGPKTGDVPASVLRVVPRAIQTPGAPCRRRLLVSYGGGAAFCSGARRAPRRRAPRRRGHPHTCRSVRPDTLPRRHRSHGRRRPEERRVY